MLVRYFPMMSLDDFEVLAPHNVPVRYGVDGAMSGSDPDMNDVTTEDDPVVGTPAELGGQDTTSATYGSNANAPGTGLTNEDDVNFTGMSTSPMSPTASGPNINGSGSDAQQVSSRSYASAATQVAANSTLAASSHFGSSVAGSLLAPIKNIFAKPTLTQTSQKGLSKGAEMVLFFMVGVLIALIVFE
jgi:hypothetical protein